MPSRPPHGRRQFGTTSQPTTARAVRFSSRNKLPPQDHHSPKFRTRVHANQGPHVRRPRNSTSDLDGNHPVGCQTTRTSSQGLRRRHVGQNSPRSYATGAVHQVHGAADAASPSTNQKRPADRGQPNRPSLGGRCLRARDRRHAPTASIGLRAWHNPKHPRAEPARHRPDSDSQHPQRDRQPSAQAPRRARGKTALREGQESADPRLWSEAQPPLRQKDHPEARPRHTDSSGTGQGRSQVIARRLPQTSTEDLPSLQVLTTVLERTRVLRQDARQRGKGHVKRSQDSQTSDELRPLCECVGNLEIGNTPGVYLRRPHRKSPSQAGLRRARHQRQHGLRVHLPKFAVNGGDRGEPSRRRGHGPQPRLPQHLDGQNLQPRCRAVHVQRGRPQQEEGPSRTPAALLTTAPREQQRRDASVEATAGAHRRPRPPTTGGLQPKHRLRQTGRLARPFTRGQEGGTLDTLQLRRPAVRVPAKSALFCIDLQERSRASY